MTQGWGCTIRCGQMMFAQIIKTIQPKLSNDEIVRLFYDEPKAPLSIHKICGLGTTMYTGKPGMFWSCLTAMLCIRDLYLEHLSKSNSSEQKTESFSSLTFTNNVMSFKEITQSTLGLEEIRILPENDDFDMNQVKVEFCSRKVIFFIGMFGGDSITEENFLCLKEIFKLPYCKGMIAGVETRAYYLFGTLGDQFMFLDPHMTQVG